MAKRTDQKQKPASEPPAPRSPALAANMKRLMAGRSIGRLRAEMAQQGIRIGMGSINALTQGNAAASSRLETLEKVAAFFDTTVDQLLQFDGVDEAYWPFSAELQQAVLTLNEEELLQLEAAIKAILGLRQPSPPGGNNEVHLYSSNGLTRQYSGRAKEESAGGLPANISIGSPAPKEHERRKDHRPAHKKPRGGT